MIRKAVSLTALGMLFLGSETSPKEAPTTSAPVYAKQVLIMHTQKASSRPTGPSAMYSRQGSCFQ
jgi:hypothetical protein